MNSEQAKKVLRAARLPEAEVAARELEVRAERLIQSAMQPTYRQGKRKWSTGRERWEALQREGERAAGVGGAKRGRPAVGGPTTPAERVLSFLTRLQHLERKAAEDPNGLFVIGEVVSLRLEAEQLGGEGLLDLELADLAAAVLG